VDEKIRPVGLLRPGEQDTPATRVPSGRLTPSVPAQDLSRDLLIAYAPRRQFAGAQRPALDGIPLLAKLAQAGMAAVYYGVHPWLNIEVAVKVLPFHLGEPDPQAIERFIREARNAAQASSPHLVSVKDVKQDSGICFIVMEFVKGRSAEGSLKQAQESGAPGLPEAHALEICIAATEGLAAAHRQGILHRNIKPRKILIPSGESGALDFAAAKLADLSSMAPGTPGFMAPEQGLSAKKAGKPADVFSMGATLYALLAGRAPFTGETGLEIMLHTLQDPHAPLR
jgi:serine/threonine protein kinase